MTGERLLIVNADDLGLSPGVNAGILEAHERGIVTSTSLMVRAGSAAEAAALSSRHPGLAVGLHLDIAEWQYENGEWHAIYERCPPDDAAAVEAECRDQLAAFRELTGRDPTHLDSHQHTHMNEPVASVATRLSTELRVPLRGRGIRYEGGFYGQSGKGEPYPAGIEAEHLIELIEALPPGQTEVGCHPGIGNDTGSSYAAEREQELRALCDPRVKAALEKGEIRLRSFAQIFRSARRSCPHRLLDQADHEADEASDHQDQPDGVDADVDYVDVGGEVEDDPNGDHE